MRFAIIETNLVVNVAESDAPLAPNWIESNEAGIGWAYVGGVFVPPDPVTPEPLPPVVPIEITMRQARLVLNAGGYISAINAAIAAMAEPQKSQAAIEWEYSNTVQRHNGFVSALGPVLGLSEGQIDAMFIAGAAL